MHDTRVVIRDSILVVLTWASARRYGIDEQGGAIEGGADACGQGAHFGGVGTTGGEGAGGTGEDVAGAGLGECAHSWEGEERIDDIARDGTPLGLGIDRELLAGVGAPDLGDVGLEVVGEEIGVHDDAVVWTQGAEVLA